MFKSEHKECQHVYQVFQQIYDFKKIVGELELPAEFIPEVKGWLNNDEKLFRGIRSQVSVHTYLTKIQNFYTFLCRMKGNRKFWKIERLSFKICFLVFM